MSAALRHVSPAPSAGRPLLLAGLAALVAFVVYWRGFDAPFVLDDESSVTENYSIRDLSRLGRVLSPPNESTVGGRPVANLTYALNFAWGALSPRGYRVTNFIIHCTAALLLFGVVRRSLRCSGAARPEGAAVAVAAIWMLHPAQTSVVAYVSQRTEQLMALFYLLTLYAFVRASDDPRRAARWLVVSVVACALGMGSKEVMVTAPVLVLLYDRTFVAGTFAAAWQQRWRYYLGLGATWLLLAKFMSTGLHQRAVGFGLGVPWWRYALTETEAVMNYLRLGPWPHPLIFDYGPSFLNSVGAAAPAGLVILVLLGASLFALRQWPKAGFLAIAFFGLLAPTSSVVPIAAQPIAESRMYLPLACVVSLAVLALSTVGGRRARPVWAALALVYSLTAYARIGVIRDPVALWQDTLAKRPDNARVRSNFGAALFALGRTEEALVHEKRALELDSTVARAHVNYAAALLKQGRVEEALEHGMTALRLAPGITDAHYQVGNALARLGRSTEAIEHYRAELQLRPDYANAYSNIGSMLYLLGRPADAIPQFERALQLNPDAIDTRNNLASALSQVGRAGEAIDLYRRSLAANPRDVVTRCNLAVVLAQSGRLDEAEAEFRAALQVQPDFPTAREGLAGLQRFRATQKSPR